MQFSTYKNFVKADLYRYCAKVSLALLLRQLVFGSSFKYVFWMRTCKWSRSHSQAKWTIFPLARILLRHYRLQLGIEIPYFMEIGYGLCIGHMNGIIVSSMAVIGKNLNISQGVTIGAANRGPRMGGAIIGDCVYIGPGAKIVGKVNIGNHVAIGANCVVTSDIPDHAVVVGIPGKVISLNGSDEYVPYPANEVLFRN